MLRLGRSLLLSLEHFTIISLVSNADFPVYSVSQIYPNITNMDVIFTMTDTKKQGDPALEHRIKLVHLSHITVFQALMPPPKLHHVEVQINRKCHTSPHVLSLSPECNTQYSLHLIYRAIFIMYSNGNVCHTSWSHNR